jgi:hypothetical protein
MERPWLQTKVGGLRLIRWCRHSSVSAAFEASPSPTVDSTPQTRRGCGSHAYTSMPSEKAVLCLSVAKSEAFRAAHSPAATSRCIRITRSSRVSRFGRQLDAARLREAYLRTACENPVNVRYQRGSPENIYFRRLFSCRSFGNGLRFRRGSGSGLCANAHGAPFWMIDFERICLSHQIA